ncbi:MAG: L,D-transpeptidase family protein [Planctomycetes bacterium]|nr:L,D-transpeptidase family protein [Planctomycetota bacterium]
MLKATAVAAVIAAITVFAWFRGWLPVRSNSAASAETAAIATAGPETASPTPRTSPGGTDNPQNTAVKPPARQSGLDLFQMGDYEAAIPRLAEEITKNKTSASLYGALASCYEKTGRPAEAQAAWSKLAENCPKAAERSSALTRLYVAAEGAARVDAGMRLLRECPESAEAAAHVMAIADAAEKHGRPLAAWEALSLALQIGAGNESAIVTRCVTWADALAFSPKEVAELGTVYVVKQGDFVVSIARRHKVDPGVIERVNKLKNGGIRAGQRLKVLTAKPAIEVSIRKLWLRLYLNGLLARQFPVCTGNLDESPTPIGDFSVATKLVNPEWTRPGQRAVPHDDPENPLGTRWMGFAEPGYTSYGIHGTIKPETIGTHASNGCVRMRNEHVEELFDLVPSGTPIHIHE